MMRKVQNNGTTPGTVSAAALAIMPASALRGSAM